LTRSADLEAVRREGKRFRTATLEVRYIASLSHHSRLGVIVPRHKRSAVDRNRVKRRLRDLLRTRVAPALVARASLDVVVRAFPEAYAMDHAALAVEVERIVRRLVEASTAS
jgi:ribonuclease P protein component